MTDATAAIAFGHWYPSTINHSGLFGSLFGIACSPTAGYGVVFTGVSKKTCHCCQKPDYLFADGANA
jgi:hypothetical protein